MLTPHEIVDVLDTYIIGQDKAKRAVAIALRNRYRRSCLSEEMREEITPKNIILMGPTGVGKTEIARRLAKLVDAPFIKVEATKFTEVGYVGRDVESIIRDLAEAAIRLTKNRRMEEVRFSAEIAVEEQLADLLLPMPKKDREPKSNPFQLLLSAAGANTEEEPELTEEEKEKRLTEREEILLQLRAGKLEDTMVEIHVEEKAGGDGMLLAAGMDIDLGNIFGGIIPPKTKARKLPVKEARRILIQQESEKRIDMDDVTAEAIRRAEQDGIVFLDEIDKIAGGSKGNSPDVSREGVQRDILPIVEGTTVSTKYGPVKTDHILFIAAGAFHVSKVTDLIPELQGRFPVRVRLDNLTKEDFIKILTQPQNAVTKQYTELLSADKVHLSFTEEALEEIAAHAALMNSTMENIGARRLHTVMEDLLEDISFNANGEHPDIECVIDKNYVTEHLKDECREEDMHRYIL